MARQAFQHRHYKALADILADTRQELGWSDLSIKLLEKKLCRLFKEDNPSFSEARFVAAAWRDETNMHGKDKVKGKDYA